VAREENTYLKTPKLVTPNLGVTSLVSTLQRHCGWLAKQKLHWYPVDVVRDSTTALQDSYLESEMAAEFHAHAQRSRILFFFWYSFIRLIIF
jgi:hypothetical protein